MTISEVTFDRAVLSSNENAFEYAQVAAAPIPAAAWLFGSGLIGLAGIARRKKNA